MEESGGSVVEQDGASALEALSRPDLLRLLTLLSEDGCQGECDLNLNVPTKALPASLCESPLLV
jgi:hypothetical protein